MNRVSLTVIMCAFNAEKYICESIESIINQTFNDFEFVIIDDCSTDGTGKIIERYAELDKRLRVFKNKSNLGLTKSLNIGLEVAQGEFIARIDADDIADKDRLKIQHEFLLKHKDIALVGTAMSHIDEYGCDDERIRRFPCHHFFLYQRLIHLGAVFPHSSVMFRKKEVLDIGGYSDFFTKSQDRDLFIRIAEKYKIYCLKTNLIKWRIRHDSLSFSDNGQSQFLYGFVAIICHYLRNKNIEINNNKLINVYENVKFCLSHKKIFDKKEKLDAFIDEIKYKSIFVKLTKFLIFIMKNSCCISMIIRKKIGFLSFDPLVKMIIRKSI